MNAENNKPTRVASAGGAPLHVNGTVGTSADTITVAMNSESKITTRVYIRNTHGTNTLEVILDGSASGFVLQPSEILDIPVSVGSFDVKGSAAGTTYEAILTM